MTTEALDRNSLSFFLEFINNSEGRIQVAEPAKFDALNLIVEQEKGRFGRDVNFAGNSFDLEFFNKTFQNGLTHQFTLLQEYDKRFGFESQIKFIVQENGVDYILGELDFETRSTDQIEVYRFKVLQENEQAIIKRRSDISINLFATEDLDGNTIDPIPSEKILIQAKPRNLDNDYGLAKNESKLTRANPAFFAGKGNVYTQIRKAEITAINQPDFVQPNNIIQIDRSHILLADRSIKKARIVVENVDIRYKVRINRNVADFPLYFGVEKGLSASNLNVTIAENRIRIDDNLMFEGTETFENGNYTWNVYRKVLNFTLDLDIEVVAGEKLWIYFDLDRPTGSGDFGDRDELVFIESNGLITLKGIETDLNSVTQSVRLIDAMKQVCKSIGQFNVTAPRFDVGGELYDQRIFDGNQLRGFESKPFYLTFEEIQEHIQEFAGDYEITSNGEIFYGVYEDFYTNALINEITEIVGNLDSVYNERYLINAINFEYKEFEEDREESGTLESVHTKSQSLIPNVHVENEKEIILPFIRDPFKLESIRIKSIEVKEDQSLEEDNKKFILESIESITPFRFTEVVVVNHVDAENGTIRLLNDSSFSWIRIGVQVTAGFTSFILNNINANNYRVVEVQDTLLTLEPETPLVTVQEGSFSTSFTYDVLSVTIKNLTNEGFTKIEGVTNTEGYSNLNFTIKRNLLKYWGSYLNTACQFRRNTIIKNTFFKNNKDLTTLKIGETVDVVEGADIDVETLNDRILTPNLYSFEVRSNYGQVNTIIQKLRDERGYITFKDNRNEVIQLHPSKLEYSFADQKLTLTGEERYQVTDFLTITSTGGIIKIVQIGFPDIVTSQIISNIDNENVLIYDSEMLLLRGPIKYFNISVNGVIGITATETQNLIENL